MKIDGTNLRGPKINITKTKIIIPETKQINEENTAIENVIQYSYLGHIIPLGKDSKSREISRRTQLIWAAFGRYLYMLRNQDIPINLRRIGNNLLSLLTLLD